MSDCLFCKIVAGEIPVEAVYQTDTVLVFPDIHPIAERHYLIIPKAHIESAREIHTSNREIMGDLVVAANAVAERDGISGFQFQMNVGKDGGQTVMHMHLHFLAGKRLREGQAG